MRQAVANRVSAVHPLTLRPLTSQRRSCRRRSRAGRRPSSGRVASTSTRTIGRRRPAAVNRLLAGAASGTLRTACTSSAGGPRVRVAGRHRRLLEEGEEASWPSVIADCSRRTGESSSQRSRGGEGRWPARDDCTYTLRACKPTCVCMRAYTRR